MAVKRTLSWLGRLEKSSRRTGGSATADDLDEQGKPPMRRFRPATVAAQALGWVDETTKAITPAIHPTTTFVRDADNAYRAGFSYARAGNPTFVQPEALLTELEGGEASLVF